MNWLRIFSYYSVSLAGIAICVQGCAPLQIPYSRAAVTNSTPVSGSEFQAVVKLSRFEADAREIICTGTFIDSFRIITAAHCLGNSDAPILYAEWSTDGMTSIVKPVSVAAVHPQFKRGGKAIQASDIAILSIDAAEAIVPPPMALFKDRVLIGSEVTLVGYGNNIEASENGNITGTGAGIKRVGKNRIYTSTRSGLIMVSGDPGQCPTEESNSATANGDSGGPALINGDIAGITLGGGLIPTDSEGGCPKAISYFANLQLEQNADFIRNNMN